MNAAIALGPETWGMAGQLDQISRLIGNIESKMDQIQVRTDEDRQIGNIRHIENKEAIRNLTALIDGRAIPVQPAAWLSKWRLTGLASIGLTVLGALGLVTEAVMKWALNWAVSHFH